MGVMCLMSVYRRKNPHFLRILWWEGYLQGGGVVMYASFEMGRPHAQDLPTTTENLHPS